MTRTIRKLDLYIKLVDQKRLTTLEKDIETNFSTKYKNNSRQICLQGIL